LLRELWPAVEIRGAFAVLRMTTKNRERQKQVPCGNDNQRSKCNDKILDAKFAEEAKLREVMHSRFPCILRFEA
jgi:hypothetical protein